MSGTLKRFTESLQVNPLEKMLPAERQRFAARS